jgi:tripartite ATP-independent transporter DctM subunit
MGLGSLTLITLLIGMPISFSVAMVCMFYFILSDSFTLTVVPQKIVSGMDSFLLLAIPFFLLAGSLMNFGGATRRLVAFASSLVGHFSGGLGHVTVVANVIMAGMSGSATADAVATGSVLIPAMVKEGYTRGFAAAISAAAATIGPVIPPSIAFVIFGSLTGVSVGQLFVAGFIPGLLMGVYLMVACWLIARKRGYRSQRRATRHEIWQSFVDAIPALLTPIFVVVGLVGGFVTPTEAAAVVAFYSFIIGFCFGELKLTHLPAIAREVVVLTAVVYLLIGVFNLAGWILAVEQIPQAFVGAFLGLTDNWVMAMLLINALLLILGLIMEPVPMMVLLGPMLMPVAVHYGIDPVHFGVVFVLNMLIGVAHPPIGTNMFVTCSIAKCTISEFTWEVIPFLSALILLLLVITYIPMITLFLPTLLMR